MNTTIYNVFISQFNLVSFGFFLTFIAAGRCIGGLSHDAVVDKFASKWIHPSANLKYISATSTSITTINYDCTNNPPTLIVYFCTLLH